MKNVNTNIGFNASEEAYHFPQIELKYPVSKDEVWENLSHRIVEPRSQHTENFAELVVLTGLHLLLPC